MLKNFFHVILGHTRWHTNFPKGGAHMRRYDTATGQWQRRELTPEEADEAEMLWAIK